MDSSGVIVSSSSSSSSSSPTARRAKSLLIHFISGEGGAGGCFDNTDDDNIHKPPSTTTAPTTTATNYFSFRLPENTSYNHGGGGGGGGGGSNSGGGGGEYNASPSSYLLTPHDFTTRCCDCHFDRDNYGGRAGNNVASVILAWSKIAIRKLANVYLQSPLLLVLLPLLVGILLGVGIGYWLGQRENRKRRGTKNSRRDDKRRFGEQKKEEEEEKVPEEEKNTRQHGLVTKRERHERLEGKISNGVTTYGKDEQSNKSKESLKRGFTKAGRTSCCSGGSKNETRSRADTFRETSFIFLPSLLQRLFNLLSTVPQMLKLILGYSTLFEDLGSYNGENNNTDVENKDDQDNDNHDDNNDDEDEKERDDKARAELKSDADNATRESGVELHEVPKHIAVIMDGNRRYGRAKYGSATKGHWDGSKTLVDFAKWCMAEGVQVLTVYAFSTENWNREPTEVAALMSIFCKYCDELRVESLKRGIRVRVLSTETDKIPDDVKAGLQRMTEETEQCNKFTMNICLSYGSRGEIVNACRALAKDAKDENVDVDAIEERHIQARLLTSHCTDPDVVIRTSGELRLSNFLLWQLAYAELFFLEKQWPELKKDDLLGVIRTYSRGRQRRFGK